MSADTMIDIRFGGDIQTTNESLERVVELIIRARAAKVRASIDSNFIVQLVQEVLLSRDIQEQACDSVINLDDMKLSSAYSALDREAIFLGEEEEIKIPVEVEEFTLSDIEESADVDEEEDELDEEDLITKNPPLKRKKKVYARNDGYWLDKKTNRIWSMLGLVLVITLSVLFCISYM